ncbi:MULTISPECIES: metallophosphoesterase [unclassified Ensifer]|uniref:metallophosphoesterase n=1 Tax=unclassified Ensifer TaxID=2633371 RepID=UPI000813B1AE|nr:MULTISPECIES: metallophosphoesterase [unclassified Ensifer]OCO97987.1 metallophosphoesterase [Ensifer sp. LC11]OCO98626.1 metallophosphoesterase [Ensifer sp. LC13]OCP04310.1 metallophosphoesterase [Ensifer sp. LC14]OCP29302.1 metallophosphoesterase [Ensifer sp. LC499]
MITRRGLLKMIGGGIASMAALGGYAFAVEPLARLNVTRYKLTPPNWTPGLKLRAVVLTDIHACEPWMPASRIASICRQANSLGGDITLLLGDYVAGMNLVTRYVHSSEWSQALATLTAPLGVHAVMGNHDWWEDRTAQKNGGGPTFGHKALQDVGINVYSNRAVRLEKEGQGFWIAGLEDQLALVPGKKWQRKRMSGLDDLEGTLAQVSDTDPVILLAHEPDVFPRVPSRVALTLSGHTHGGQVRFLGYAPVVPSRFGDRYAYGHMVENDCNLIVSGGLGCSLAPVRFGVPPEIVVIDLG